MALDTTISGEDSNSYNTLAEIEASLFGSALEAWKSIRSKTEREAYAIRATEVIDMQRYAGEPYNEDQALVFPRSSGSDEEIPAAVKKAQNVQISYMLTSSSDSAILNYRNQGVTSMGLGVGNTISFDRSKSSPVPKDLLCAEARMLLTPYFSHMTLRLDRG